MSGPRDSPMDATVSSEDVIVNRLNIALARSQRLIHSWRSPQTADDDEQPESKEDEDSNFEGLTEKAGLGSKVAEDEDETPAAILRQKRLASKDKLLEQLLGKKAAQAHKKSQAAGKDMSASKHASPKALTSRPKPFKREAESESEDEGGRASVFKSHKSSRPRAMEPMATDAESHKVNGSEDVAVKDEGGSSDDDRGGSNKSSNVGRTTHRKPPKGKKSASYLDEILSQKAKKKKRR